MQYIHNNHILHRDLKPANILLDENLYPKIADFGLSKDEKDISLKEKKRKNKGKDSGFVGTFLYCSPEIIKYHSYQQSSDVYAFGLIVYEIMTNEIPFKVSNIFEFLQCLNNNHRPSFIYPIPFCYKNLIQKCWLNESYQRPSFTKIINELENNHNFITPNVNEQEFLDYVYYLKENENKAINEVSNNNTAKNAKPINKPINSNDENINVVHDDLLVKVDETKYDIFLDLSNYERQEIISKFDFSKIYKLQEKKTKNIYSGQISMIKMTNLMDEDLTKFSNELENISKLNHPSLLKFIGYSPTDFKNNRKPVIVTEYSSNGSLYDILQTERLNNSIQGWDETKKLINIYGIASGMSYLHSHNILHCCLKPSTIYLNEILFPKIGDFGLSMKFYNPNNLTIQSISGFQGLPLYSAPEVLQYNTYSKASDVYSFAFIVYEIITNEVPFKDINTFNKMMTEIVFNGNRPELNQSIPKKYRELIEKCWCQDPDQRMTFEEITFSLRTDKEFITDKINKNSYLKYIEYIENSSDHEFNYKNISSKQVDVIESKMNENITNQQFSIEYYKEIAESGNIEAQVFLFKKFTKENDTENIYKYLCMLIKTGSCDAPIEFAIKLFNGKHYKQAFKYFTAISKTNHPIAKYFIGLMKFFGYGCDKNHDDSYRIMNYLSNNGIERATEFIENHFNK